MRFSGSRTAFIKSLPVVSPVANFEEQSWTTLVFAALDQSGLPAFLPHSGRLAHQVMSARAHGLERAPLGPAIAPPLCVYAHLHTGLASDQRGSPPGCFSHPACSWTGREFIRSLTSRAPCPPMSRGGEPLYLAHAFYATRERAFCQQIAEYRLADTGAAAVRMY